MPALYKITDDMAKIMDLFDAEEIDEQTLNDTMESLNADLSNKVDDYGKYIASLNSNISGFDAEIKRMEERKKQKKAIIERLKVNLLESLQVSGKQKISGALFTAAICKNPPSVYIADEKVIPLEYCVIADPKPDKTAIKAAIKAGENVPGAELRQSEGVRIK